MAAASTSSTRHRWTTTLYRKPGELDHLAPLHKPPAVSALRYLRASLPTIPRVALFDTAFHCTLIGDLDPGALLLLLRAGIDAERLDDVLNRRSRLTGTSDMRQIEHRAASGDRSYRLAITLYSHRVRKYIGAYAAVMDGVNGVAFTAVSVRTMCRSGSDAP